VYMHLVRRATARNRDDGFLLPEDAEEMIADAARSLVGTGLVCGPLCSNEAQFPLHPSTSILRDHTRFYYFRGGEELLNTIDWATYWVARGYSQPQGQGGPMFAKAVGFLETYADQVSHLRDQGRAAPESAALLTEYAGILIERLQALAGP
jgi:hypothetical protein